MLLVLGLIAQCELSFGILNSLFDEATFVLGAHDVVPDPLDLHVLLVKRGLCVHDVAIDLVVAG